LKKKEKATPGNKAYIIGVIILVLLVIVVYSIVPSQQPPPPTSTTNTAGGGGTTGSALDEFAKCLTVKGVKMYGASWCPHCKNQKDAFGSSFQYVDYVECTERQADCDNAGIEGYPTWIINGEKFPGEQSFEELSQQSGCKY
jgi:glutaredoxin